MNVEDIYELSPLQAGMLLHTVHDGSADMYLGQHVYIVEGALDSDTLIQAWRQVFEAHPALRTSFHWDGLDKPLQVVHREVVPPAHIQDWSDQPEADQHQRLERLMAEDRATGFDLTAAPLQRLYLVRLGPDLHALAWTHHHLLLDGWSVPIFMNEVMTHYQLLITGGPRPALAPPFREYIGWLDKQDTDAARTFWADTLGNVRPRALPGLRPLDPRRATSEPRRLVADIAGPIEEALRAAATRHRVTFSTMLQAAWATVLSRCTGSSEPVFGCVSSGRPADLPDVDRMIGMFVNTLPVALTVPDDADVGEWLREIQRRYAAMRRYEFSPLSDVKRWAGQPGQQLFDSLVVFANYSFGVGTDSPLAGQLSVRSQTTFDKVSVPLSVIVTPAPISELHLLWHEERFDAAYVEDILARLLAVLEAITRAERTSGVLDAAGALVAVEPFDVAAPGIADSPPVPPATPEEEAVAAVWCDILGLNEIDVTANFFDIGGDSFAAVRAVGRIEGSTVALLALNPTVRDFVVALGAVEPDDADDDLDAEIAELERRLAETSARAGQPPVESNPAATDHGELARQLRAYYEGPGRAEAQHDESGHGELEFERTKEILLRHLPPAPAAIADIGGGAGRVALWLAGLGYQVMHRDVVPLFVDELNALATAAGLDIASAVGDARRLDLADDSVDAVLLLGPLYHLPVENDRLAALREARRIVRPGGAVFSSAISRWATRCDAVLRGQGYESGPEVLELIASVEQSGVLPPLTRGGYTAYTHLPQQLAAELQEAGLDVTDLVSVEGAAILLSDLTQRMADPPARAAILDGARAHERVPELLGLGPHLIATGTRS